MPIIPFSTYLEYLWFPIIGISVAALIKLFIILIENKFKKIKKEKVIYEHIKMVDEQKEKYKRDKEQRIKEEKIRLKKEYYEKEKRKI